jgi:hypothetical protein
MAGETTPDIYKNNNIFSKLKRLFSTDVIIRNVGGDNITVLDTNKIQVSGEIETNALHDRYNRLYTTNSNPLYNFNANYPTLRLNLYQDYEMMDTDPIIASTLDIISDESTLKDDLNDVLSIKSSDEDVQKLLYNLFYDVLNIEFNLWSWIRQMCKFGDFFLKLEIAEKFGVFNVIPFSAYNITREEGYDRDKPSSIRFRYDPTGNLGASGYMGGMYSDMVNKDAYYFDNYEMAHFRLLADSNYLPYGRSYIEPARKAYKQMALMEDAMLIHRIVRAPERRIFYINVGSIPPADVEAFMEKTISKMKRTPYVDPQTGEYNLKYNMENLLEDFFIPVRGGDSTTKLDTAPGLAYDGIKDVEYLRDKMMTALKVPKAFFGYDANLCISPETTIPLLDGRILKVKDIINEYNEGKINYVYSIDEKTKNIVPGEIEWAGFTRMNTQTIKVWLDNEKFIQCTPDHLFMTRDGEWKEAQNLQEGESLMPLYLEKSKEKKINGYTKVYNPNNGKFEFVHRLVANYFNLKENGKEKVIHHIDCNKLNNNPENLYCSKECRTKNNTQKNKFKNVSLDQLINLSSNCKNFKELMVLLNIKDHSTLTRIFNNLNINKSEFIINYMPLSHTNFRFMSQFKETNKFYLENQYNYKNHKVLRIEFVEDKIDTCDLTIKNYHNFGTEAGIIIHNSGKATLAAEDIRFARTIERIQRIVTSELYKIAFIHLYTQGYRGEELSNFELSLTTPSIIYDQEKIALLKEKVDLAKNIMEAKLLPKDWIYDNIFHYSEDQFDEYKDLIIQDAKDEFRLKQIGDEGNDPLESGKSYGTPHDLASLYGKGRYTTNNSVPKGYDKDEPGRPTEKASYVGTQKDPLGKDRIGKSDYKDIGPEDNRFRNRKKGPNPLALEGKYKVLLESMQNNKKINIYDKEKDINFLNENNIL